MPVVSKLAADHLTAIIERGDIRYVASCPELDLAAEGDTPEEAFEDLVAMAIEYAEEYAAEFALYSEAPNRAHHWRYLEGVLREKDDPAKIRGLFV